MKWVSRFFLLVVVLSFSELYLLVKVSEAIDFLPTLGICILTGILGGSLVRKQGLSTIFEIQSQLSQGQIPTQSFISGLILFLVGAFLLTPGFITDTFGFLLLIPPLRMTVVHQVHAWFLDRFKKSPPSEQERIIDVDPGDFSRKD